MTFYRGWLANWLNSYGWTSMRPDQADRIDVIRGRKAGAVGLWLSRSDVQADADAVEGLYELYEEHERRLEELAPSAGQMQLEIADLRNQLLRQAIVVQEAAEGIRRMLTLLESIYAKSKP